MQEVFCMNTILWVGILTNAVALVLSCAVLFIQTDTKCGTCHPKEIMCSVQDGDSLMPAKQTAAR